MDGYNGSIELIAGLTTKNGNTGYFLLNTEQIQATAEGKSLFDYLNDLVIGGGTGEDVDLDGLFMTNAEITTMLDGVFSGTSAAIYTAVDADGYTLVDSEGYEIIIA